MINFSIIAKDKIYLHFFKKKNPKDFKKKSLTIHLKPKGKGEQG